MKPVIDSLVEAMSTERNDDSRPVRTVRDLSTGDHLEVFGDGILQLRGVVDEIHPVLEVFWVIDSLGERRLIDLDTHRAIAKE